MVNELMASLNAFVASAEVMIKGSPFLSSLGSFVTGGAMVKLGSLLLERRAKRIELAKQDLVDLYSPLQRHFEKSGSLDEFLRTHAGLLEKDIDRFDKKIQPLLRDALNRYVPGGMGLGLEPPE